VGDAINDLTESVEVREASECPVDRLKVTLKTGTDDKRCGVPVHVVLGLRNRAEPYWFYLGADSFNGGSVREFNVSLPRGTVLSDIVTFGIYTKSWGSCFPDADIHPDNWDLVSVRVEIPDFGNTLLERAGVGGSTLVRFTGDLHYWEGGVRLADGVLRRIPLFSWYSPSRGDFRATTDRQWAGFATDRRAPDYAFTRQDGFVFSPETEPRSDLAPLYTWYSPARGDHFTTTDPAWAASFGPGPNAHGYYHLRLEGYVYSVASGVRPGRVALYSAWNPAHADNFLTTDTTRLPAGYTVFRHEGYVDLRP